MSIYFKELVSFDKNNYIYSVDMIRLKCRISPEFFAQKISSRLDIMSGVEYWTSTQLNRFKNEYNIKIDEENAFWLGYISNSELYGKNRISGINNPKTRYNLTIEFNPNKIQDSKILMYLLSLNFETIVNQPINWCLVRCDFAFDIPNNILSLTGFDKGRKKCLTTYDNGGDDKTFYLGTGNNRIKIYNKKIESQLDYDLTRIELTHEFDNLDIKEFLRTKKTVDLSKYFPTLYLQEYQMDFSEIEKDSTFKALLYAVNNGFPLHDLTKYYRHKIKDFMQEKKPICIDFSNFDSALSSTLQYYFSYYL